MAATLEFPRLTWSMVAGLFTRPQRLFLAALLPVFVVHLVLLPGPMPAVRKLGGRGES